ncbi:MAG: GH92 family glycosyl hydrolase [Actinomyces sp.]|nr:GH92 family glycosyl hydrolase [Actinomyces sp.]MCI1640956.1 GH92 family glycosyl hydrolase [Actinomyces sp.]MCI1661324.1 GH92 family glycosyl hydrolase [Actinomyces sp.]MCI1690332.1 GH92 family glycosyl hydrolase [Actinomyces sp.]MCI1786973.1 GH92 family glycosyl hydrolase [Actinomyces sp.]MCI1829461.1 GH92 family glycosyl hydrolase [Actinomyces sp.]
MTRGLRSRIGALAAVGALTAAGAVSATPPAQAAEGAPADHVDTLIGTGTGGEHVGTINQFPGPAVPYGMVQFSPDTSSTYWGYSHDNPNVTGFSMTHSSAGCTAFGDIPILPTTTAPGGQPWYATERIAHDDTEVGVPGYYTAQFPDTGVTAELSATTRTGIGRFTFSKADAPAYVHVRSGGSLNGNSDAEATVSEDLTTVTGSATTGDFCGKGNEYTIYYAVEFSQPAQNAGTWGRDGVNADGVLTGTGGRSGAWLQFPGGQTIETRVGISFVSVEGARANLAAESGGRSFDEIRASAGEAWNDALSRIEVSGGSAEDTEMFYTSLYRAMLHPNTFDDADGRYLGLDGTVHQLEEGQDAQYTNVSDWDTYRSLVPLQAMLDPDVASDLAQSLVNDAKQSGAFPRWKMANGTTNQMTGDNVVPLIVNAHAFGGTGFDTATALTSMVSSALTGNQNQIQPQYWERKGAEQYNGLGYAPPTAAFHGDQGDASASTTQEWSIDDFAIGRFAEALGDSVTATEFQERSTWWRNVFNPAWNTVAPRAADGTFLEADRREPPRMGESGFDEGNSEQYLWLVPQDIDSLVSAIGGREAAAERLDAFFQKTNAGADEPYMWAGNEIDFHIPWLYDFVGQPWRTQEVTDAIRTSHYGPTINGLPGNDDLGAMSSWYLWAAMGLYPITPGTTNLAVSTPVFEKIVIRPGAGDQITITAPGARSHRYISGLSVNGQPADRAWVAGGDVLSGGTIDYTLSAERDTSWATGEDAAPPSYGEGGSTLLAGAEAPVSVAPGGTVQATVAVRNIGTDPVTVTGTGPEGSPLTAAVPKATIGAGELTRIPVTISADAAAVGATAALPVRLAGGGETATAVVPVTIDAPMPLENAFGIVATAPKGDRGAIGDFDHEGASYQREGLSDAGLAPGAESAVPGTDLAFTWPSSEAGEPDAVQPTGQTILVPGHPTSMSFIGAARNGGQSAEGTIFYSDGSSATLTLGLDDWVIPTGPDQTPSFGDIQVTTMPERNTASGPATNGLGAIIWSTPVISAPEGLTITHVVLPTAEKQRIFAIATNAPDQPAEPAATTTTLRLSAESVVEGETSAVTATVAVSTAEGAGRLARAPMSAPAGVVAIAEGDEVLVDALEIGGDGTASAALSAELAVGDHALTAVFTPADAEAYAGSESEAVVLTVTAKQTPPVDPIVVTPGEVTFTDRDGTADDTYTIPGAEGVEYVVDGQVVEPGAHPATGEVIVTARPAGDGYVLADGAAHEWSYTFSAGIGPAPRPSSTEPANPSKPSTGIGALASTGSPIGLVGVLAGLSLTLGAGAMAVWRHHRD